MKKVITIIFLFATAFCFGQNPIRVNAGTDTVDIGGVTTIIKYKAELTAMPFDGYGSPMFVQYLLRRYAFDGNTELTPSGNDVDRELLTAKEVTFNISGYINTVTKKLSKTNGGANQVLLSNYLKDKALNSYPGVANGDPLSDLIEGILREVVAIKQTNKQLNNN